MNTSSVVPNWPTIWTILGAILAGIVAVTTAAGIKLPVITSERAAFIVLVVLGLIMCSTGGIGRAVGTHGWQHPVTIAGIVLGVLVLALTGAVLLGVRLPLVADDRAAVIALAALMAVKLAINAAASFLS